MHFQPIENFSELTVSLDRSGIIQDIAEPCKVFGSIARTLGQQAFLNLVDPAHAVFFENSLARAITQTDYAAVLNFGLIRPDGSRAELEAVLRHASHGRVQLDARIA